MTKAQKINAIALCEEELGVVFEGNINSKTDTDRFLGEYLYEAQSKAHDRERVYQLYFSQLCM